MRGRRKNQGGVNSVQKNSLGKQMWSVLSPLVVRYAIAYIVEVIIIGFYTMKKFPNVFETLVTQEQIYEQIAVVLEAILPYSTQIGAVAAVITIPCFLRMIKKDNLQPEKPDFSVVKCAFAVVMSVAVAVALNNILLLANIAEFSESYQESAEMLYSPSFPVQILCLGIIYPIMEELLFRGLIFRRVRQNTSAFNAVISSALFFGIYHGNSVQMIYGALSGVMLAYLCEKSGSVKVPIIAHMAMNMTAVILTELDAFTWMFAVPVRMVIITIVCAALGSSMLVLIRQTDKA
jgi:membrane protease YdiL (CAAX protease family)